MDQKTVKVRTLPHFKGNLPAYATPGSSGMDIRAQLTKPIELAPMGRILIPTGLVLEIPRGFEIQIRPRSGWALNQGVTLPNTPATIDSDFRGELKIIVINLGTEIVMINDQDRIAQMVLCPVHQIHWEKAEDLSNTERGTGGFGSTGTSQNYIRPVL